MKCSLVKTFKSLIREGLLDVMKNFVIGYNNMKSKATIHGYKLNFMLKTQVIEVGKDSFPSQIYVFKSFGELLNAPDVDETKLFDIIGEVIAKDSAQSKDMSGRITKVIDFVLEDLKAKVIRGSNV
ncbi:Replication protein A 70 kDa DNA-binding subunit B-like [Abeliophyllum distichum]|uniref:Replication protein A 70 kDa DNA-binding subunit B-like n=1 Tax=Abeliophyllum distichum TaxID=126358 RepID=A0ABD1NPA7_9LAMI